jgi:hypothetical protein
MSQIDEIFKRLVFWAYNFISLSVLVINMYIYLYKQIQVTHYNILSINSIIVQLK